MGYMGALGRLRIVARTVRVGLISGMGDLHQSIGEQYLGARLAAEYTREIAPATDPDFVLVERPVATESAVEIAARELTDDESCAMLLGALNVPHSIRAAQWAEDHGCLYVTANNNPLVWAGRRHVFHIGVPSEITGRAAARFVVDGRGAGRVAVLHTAGDFQVYAAACTAAALVDRGGAVEQRELGADPATDPALFRELRDWQADAMCLLGSELDRLAGVVRQVQPRGGPSLILHPRGMLCREFADAAGSAAEGHYFTDLYLRSTAAPVEEQALHRGLASVNPRLVATASHGFGWDGLRLLIHAWNAAGPRPDDQASCLEALVEYHGATGDLSFDERDHNGRWQHDPTTVAQLVGDEFQAASTLARSDSAPELSAERNSR